MANIITVSHVIQFLTQCSHAKRDHQLFVICGSLGRCLARRLGNICCLGSSVKSARWSWVLLHSSQSNMKDSSIPQLPMLLHANSISDITVVADSPYFTFRLWPTPSSPTLPRARTMSCHFGGNTVPSLVWSQLMSIPLRQSSVWLCWVPIASRFLDSPNASPSALHLLWSAPSSSTSTSRSDSCNVPKAKWRYKSSDHCNTTMYISTHIRRVTHMNVTEEPNLNQIKCTPYEHRSVSVQ